MHLLLTFFEPPPERDQWGPWDASFRDRTSDSSGELDQYYMWPCHTDLHMFVGIGSQVLDMQLLLYRQTEDFPAKEAPIADLWCINQLSSIHCRLKVDGGLQPLNDRKRAVTICTCCLGLCIHRMNFKKEVPIHDWDSLSTSTTPFKYTVPYLPRNGTGECRYSFGCWWKRFCVKMKNTFARQECALKCKCRQTIY